MGSITASDYDVVIYGASSAAVATSIQAARNGLSVALLSPYLHIGGIQIEGLGATDIDNQAEVFNSKTVGGLALELHERISAVYGRTERLNEVVAKGIKDVEIWRFESRVAEQVIADWLAEYPSIAVYRDVRLVKDGAAHKNGTKVTAVELESGQIISGKIFADCSYEGDFIAQAGVSTAVGRESSDTYGESLAGVRETTLYTQFPHPVDPYVVEGDASSGLLYGVSDEPFGTPGSADLHLAAFSYRVPLTNNPSNQLPLYAPEGYNPSHYELHRRFIATGGKLYLPNPRIPGGKTDLIGSEAVLATDLLGMNDNWATGSWEEREAILREAETFTKGLIWFFATDPAVPAEVRDAWSKFGYPLDEFPDNNHFPRSLYIRDARRMISDYVVTEHTASRDDGEPEVEDPIALAYWPTDTHCVRRIVRDGIVHNEGFIFKDGHHWRPFGISYRCMIPKRSEASNVLCPTCPSSSHVGYGAVRLEHQFYAMGQACGDAAAIALKGNLAVQDVPYEVLEQKLLAGGAKLDVTVVGAPTFPDDH
ncbi:hypothetical protein MNV49_006441 [Pseudohyphozyma bogoriensis]|nr:hypothetical protein MNV49_006441 [Pseudohyphozyma bogoriensis]